ncbi:MAG: TylF/MycF/NovP-related O-methyltransferase [Planctomycetota bacterium]
MNETRVINSIETRDAYLDARLEELAPGLRRTPFVVFGAGAHTERLARRHRSLLACARAILDDDPRTHTRRIAGVPVCAPGAMPTAGIEVVLISSDAHEDALAERARVWATSAKPLPAIVRLYRFAKIDFEHREIADALGLFRGCHDLDPVFVERWQKSLECARVSDSAWTRARYANVCALVEATAGLDGESFEAGCYRGQSSLLTCETIRRRTGSYDGSGHHIVDSFEGLSAPVEHDGDFSVRRHADGAFADTSVELLRETLRDYPRVSIYKGWIPDVLAALDGRTFRFVHLDVDLYEPILACLRFAYPRLVPGGVIVVDDYGPLPNGAYPGCARACRVFSEESGVPHAALSAGNALFIKR